MADMDAKLKQPTYMRRFIAFLIDLILLVLCTVIVYSAFTSTFMVEALGGSTLDREMLNFAADTGLYSVEYDEEGNPLRLTTGNAYIVYEYNPQTSTSINSDGEEITIITQEDYGYLMYEDLMWNFWTGFYLEDDRMDPISAEGELVEKPLSTSDPNFVIYGRYFSQIFMGLPELTASQEEENWLEFSLTHDDWEEELQDSSGFYRYSLNEEGYVDYSLPPTLTERALEGLAGSSNSQWIASLTDHFFDASTYTGVYRDLADWTVGSHTYSTQRYYLSRYSLLNQYIYYALLTAYLPFLLIFFYIIPVSTRDGRSIGKMLTHLSIVSKEAVRMKPYQRFLRPLTVLVILGLFLVPPTFIGFMLVMLFALLDFMFMVLHRSHKTFEDLLTGTVCINAHESLWFKNEEEAERYFASHPEVQEKKEKTPEEIILEKELSILDLSTLNLRREEASSISSFDEYEKDMEAKHQERLEAISSHAASSSSMETKEEKEENAESISPSLDKKEENSPKEEEEDLEEDSFLDETNKREE